MRDVLSKEDFWNATQPTQDNFGVRRQVREHSLTGWVPHTGGISVAHTHHDASYWTRRHTEAVVLDIGDDTGAMVLYTRLELHGHEIEVSLLGADDVEKQARRVHSA